MKTTLLALLCMALFSFSKTYAQPCDLSIVQIERVYTGVDGKCYADVYFDMERNNGNKFIYLHLWSSANFSKVDKSKFALGQRPTFTDINGTSANTHPALATIAINNNKLSAPEWNTSNYVPDANVVTVKGSSLQVSAMPVTGSGANAVYRYTIKAVSLGVLGGGCSAANISIIMWSTQSNTANSQIHCSIIEPISQQALKVNGSVLCSTDKYTLSITNTSDKAISGSIDLYAASGSKPYDATLGLEPARKFDAITYFVVEPNETIGFSRTIPDTCMGDKLFAQVTHSSRYVQTAELLATSCGTLPVVMQSVSAIRTKQEVLVKWQTASEQNVRGFHILRQTDETGWRVVRFVPSQAINGNSSNLLSYQYTDLNPHKGVSQYRIQEVSKEGKTTLSEVRVVRGETQAAKLTLYPNPTANGKAMIVFDHLSVRDILITDVTGRIVRQMKGITTNNAEIDLLKTGFYNVQVIDRPTGESAVVRLVVSN